MSKRSFAVASTLLAVTATVLAGASTAVIAEPTARAEVEEAMSWNVDPAHTEINFSINHFFTPVSGSFDDFEVDLRYDPENPDNSRVGARIAVASVNTGNEKRDAHLRSADWFEAETYPYITFESRTVRRVGDSRLVATGPLTIKGETREVEVPVTLLGRKRLPEQMSEMMGGVEEVASFKATTILDRGDFAVGVGNWAATLIVGGEVDVEILLEANR